jgi:predicted transcriptional regulator of viral defense system
MPWNLTHIIHCDTVFTAEVNTVTHNIKSLGSVSAGLVIRLAEKGQYVFTTADAVSILGGSTGRVSKLLHDLKSRAWVAEIERGRYVLLPLESGESGLPLTNELVIASRLVSPYYISFWTAIYHYGYTEQVPRTIFVATTERKRPIQFAAREFRFISIADHKFFGHKPVWIDADRVEMATLEKLLVDCLDLPQYAGGIKEVAKLLLGAQTVLDWQTVTDYCSRVRNGAVVKRLGFLLDLLAISHAGADNLGTLLTEGFALLDPTLPKEGRYLSKWHVQVNVPEEELTSWRLT